MDDFTRELCKNCLHQIRVNWEWFERLGGKFSDAKSGMPLTWDDIGVDFPGDEDEN